MKLYIPEIGDQIRLTKDWTFQLNVERRNVTLGKYFGHYMFFSGAKDTWIDSNVIPEIEDKVFDIKYPDKPPYKHQDNRQDYNRQYNEWEAARRAVEKQCPEFIQYQQDIWNWRDKCSKADKKEVITVTLKEGTILGIDRIYIRKGVSDFSSITFYAKNIGKINIKERWGNKERKAALRFWAKLSDVNTIEFEQVEK